MSIPVPIYGFGGGRTSLNFAVEAYATEEALLAAAPKENTIGIVTDVPITSWALSATEPAAPEAGMVWITVGKNDKAEFNVLKKNVLNVYPMLAEQYINDAWTRLVAMTYRSTEWQEWKPRVHLFRNGDDCFDVTGGWSGVSGEVIVSNGYVAVTNGKIDVSKYDTLVVNCVEYWKSVDDPTYGAGGGFGLSNEQSGSGYVVFHGGTVGTVAIDISNITGEYFFKMHTYLATLKISEIYME